MIRAHCDGCKKVSVILSPDPHPHNDLRFFGWAAVQKADKPHSVTWYHYCPACVKDGKHAQPATAAEKADGDTT